MMQKSVPERLQFLLGQLGLSASSQNTRKNMAAKKLEMTLTRGVEDGKIPHVVVFATNRDGMSSNMSSLK